MRWFVTILVVAIVVAGCAENAAVDSDHTSRTTDSPATELATDPPVEPALKLSVIMIPSGSPHIRSVVIRSRADSPVDVSGWWLESPGFERQRVAMPAGLVIGSLGSFGVYQIQQEAQDCPTSPSALYLCYSPHFDEDPALHPSGIVLRDKNGTEIATWRISDG